MIPIYGSAQIEKMIQLLLPIIIIIMIVEYCTMMKSKHQRTNNRNKKYSRAILDLKTFT